MCFSLFRSQKPKPNTKPMGHFTTTTSRTTQSNHSNNHSTTSTTSNNHQSYSSQSKSSSISSRTSLSSLKDSLPENPHIYDFSQIRAYTNNFLLKPLSSSSSSTSWVCVSNTKPSLVTQRKLRRPIDLPDLRLKLSLLCKSHHANIVKLYGATVSGNYVYLVYEFVNGASLSDCLRNPRNPNFTVLSNWLSRISVAANVADALDYMHNCVAVGVRSGFVHNHLKSSSVIICDETTLVAKICHFGTAQLCGEVPETITTVGDDSENITVLKRVGSGVGKFEGTRGYMAPEFQVTGVPTLESDVYAFGVVLLELLSGKEPIKVDIDKRTGAFQKVSLIEVAKEAVEGGTGKLRQWVDRRLRDSYPVEVAEGLARVGLECVQEDPRKRPDMGRVAGWISKLFLESKTWAQSMGFPDDITVSLAPR
ncbi:protein LYK5-like [Silene latifolia]|uniref:protein LYK5-like n=1 Tax=Silene latifolia TaxID=37657 RepID=UPI003D78177D